MDPTILDSQLLPLPTAFFSASFFASAASSFLFSASTVGLAAGEGATVDGATGGEPPPRVGAILGRLGGGAVEEDIEELDREAEGGAAMEAAAAAADLPPGCISFEPEEARES